MTDQEIDEIFNARKRIEGPFDHVAFARDIARLDRLDALYARLGMVALRFIDRANDVCQETGDTAEKILSEWASETNKELDASDLDGHIRRAVRNWRLRNLVLSTSLLEIVNVSNDD